MEKDRLKIFPLKNPNPVFQVKDGRAVLLNPPARQLLGIKKGNRLPKELDSAASAALKSGRTRKTEYGKGNRIYSFIFKPVKKQQCVNVYGFEISVRKKKETRIREATGS